MGSPCEDESDCGRWQTCCDTHCGPRCVFKRFRGDDGNCPHPALLSRVCNSTFGKLCETDRDCSGSQTCCDTVCNKRCVLSFGNFNGGSSWNKDGKSSTERTVQKCPEASRLERVCRMNHREPCEGEEDCGDWKQCCKTPCGYRCVHSFLGQGQSAAVSDLKAGECPAPSRLALMCELKYGELCEDDDDCYAWQTCCNTPCGRRCVHSFRGKSGEGCPESSRLTNVCTMSFNTQCTNDSSCEGWQTCCDTSCGNRCVPKFLSRPTQCPASTRLDVFCQIKLGDPCESDSDCLFWSSCCDSGCGKRCVPRFFMAKDDSCPAPHRLAPMCDLKLGDQCREDKDCDIWQSCCKASCGNICIPSIWNNDDDDECPDSFRAKRMCARNSSEPCWRDEDCSKWKQCCDVGCGKRCVSSFKHTNGEKCPSSSSPANVCHMKLGDECERDGDCDSWQTCCDAGCGKRCVFKFLKGVNSSCPAPSRLGPMCNVNYGKECEGDDDCDLWLSCCDAGCGKRCIHRGSRHRKREKKCPEPFSVQHLCEKGEIESCGSDEECGEWKQCCQVGDCGKHCVFPFSTSKEVFECPAVSRLAPICQMRLGERCTDNEDCDIWQSCCDSGCGRRCVLKFKSGGQGGSCPDPSRLHHMCKWNFTAPCTDESCGEWAACCDTDCGPRCIPKFMAKKPDEQCPSEDKLSKVCEMKIGKSCMADTDCDASHTCCNAGCGKKCIPTFFTGENRTCPSHRQLTMMCDMKLGDDCESDGDCDIWQMCCKASCGKKCIPSFIRKVKQRKCPELPKVSFLCHKNHSQSCEENDDCSSNKQCCEIGCGKKCLHSFTSRKDQTSGRGSGKRAGFWSQGPGNLCLCVTG
ncbi:protein jagged-1-like [Heptranchias perlo]|uniref:protein jagged-1-like n=1 Tax=Heptranchias perlo TaxID=212740 RepID=UPI00355A741A